MRVNCHAVVDLLLRRRLHKNLLRGMLHRYRLTLPLTLLLRRRLHKNLLRGMLRRHRLALPLTLMD